MEYSGAIMIFLGVFNLILVMVVLRLSLRIRRHDSDHREQNQRIKRLDDDVSALCTGAAGVGTQLSLIEQKVKRLLERQDQLDQRDPSDRALDQAIRMSRQGATVEALISTCGLVRAEAELLTLLHRAQAEQSDESGLRVVSGGQ